MTTTTPRTDEPVDPTLATLVPRRSRLRDAAAVTAGVLVVLLALASATVLRPGFDGSWAAGARQIDGTDRLDTQYWRVPTGWTTVTLLGVEDVPGATVEGAWLLPSDGTSVPSDPAGEGDPLPASAAPGTEVQVVVRWRVTDCERAAAATPVVHLRSALGLRSTVDLGGTLGDSLLGEDGRACH
ncbi:hypothetical protein [Cellulomonas massiliensis]|uniref:hypothetical protein n=1 Tax=Cellulomonas massiliensis TaxID=1465811 RepID=UPI00036776F7|nr:hypothetical protein [Cellulomonas massiliensis]